MLSEAQDRLTLGLEIVSQELATLPAQEWVSLRSKVLAPGVPLLDLQILDCLVWGCGGASHVLSCPGHSLPALLVSPSPVGGLSASSGMAPCLRMSLSWCQARCVEMRWRLSKEGSGNCQGGCWGDSQCPVHNSPFLATFWFFQLLLLLFSLPSSPSLSFLSLSLQPLATLSAFLASLGPPRPSHLPIMAPGPSLALRPRDWVWGASQPGLGALSGRQWCRRPLQLRPSCRA